MTTLKLSTAWDARCMVNMDIRMEEEDMATLTTAMTWSLQVMVMLTRALVAIIIIMTTWTVGWDSVRLSGLFFCRMNDRAILFSTEIILIIVFMFGTFQLLQDFLFLSSLHLIFDTVRAAFVHVVSDFVQSCGVFLTALVIYFQPEWKIFDPICTFIFSILVLFTTISIMKDAILVSTRARIAPNVEHSAATAEWDCKKLNQRRKNDSLCWVEIVPAERKHPAQRQHDVNCYIFLLLLCGMMEEEKLQAY